MLSKSRDLRVAAAALALVALAGSIATAYVTFGKWPFEVDHVLRQPDEPRRHRGRR
jgi:hypothetical protein